MGGPSIGNTLGVVRSQKSCSRVTAYGGEVVLSSLVGHETMNAVYLYIPQYQPVILSKKWQ